MGKLSTKGNKNLGKDKNQTKISFFFKKKDDDFLPTNRENSSTKSLPSQRLASKAALYKVNTILTEKKKGIKSKDCKEQLKKGLSLASCSFDDSDIEIIESTPEEKPLRANVIANTKKSSLIGSPEIIPPTPKLLAKEPPETKNNNFSSLCASKCPSSRNEIKSTFGISHKLNEKKKKSLYLSIARKETELLPYISSDAKRAAESRTGVSPNAKRAANDCSSNSASKPKSNCKSNLSQQFENVSMNDSRNFESDGSVKNNNCTNQLTLLKNHEDKYFSNLFQTDSDFFSHDKTLPKFGNELTVLTELDNNASCNQNSFYEDTSAASEALTEDSLRKIFDEPFEDGGVDFSQLPSSKPKDGKILLNNEGIISDSTKSNRKYSILNPSSFSAKENYGRHEVLSVNRDDYRGEVTLELRSFSDGVHKTCSLSGFWFESKVKENDIVNISSTDEVDGHFTISNEKGIIVINPDFLISGTSVVSGVFCKRKAVLNEKFKGYDSGNYIMIIGTLVHQLFQEVISLKSITKDCLEDTIDRLIQHKRTLQDLYGLQLTTDKIKEDMRTFIPLIINWSRKYLSCKGKKLLDPNSETYSGCVSSILDIEENIWSPKYGIKGKIDLTVETKCCGKTKVMPLELKTGRPSFSSEHRGQVILYSMMTSDRREDPEGGLLLYLKDGSMAEISAGEKEKKGLIQLRNELAYYLHVKKSSSGTQCASLLPLPEHLNVPRTCSQCPQLLPCSSFLKFEGIPKEPHAMASLLQQALSHLSENHLEYFRKWCLMLQCETSHSSDASMNDALWCLDAKTREDFGDCLSELVLQPDKMPKEMESGYFVQSFCRNPKIKSSKFPENFQIGDSIAVSSDKEIALSQGTVISCDDAIIDLLLDRNLRSFNPNWKEKIYRIDRLANHAAMGINYTNLAYLLQDTPRADKLRRLIIDKEKPDFAEGVCRLQVQQLRPILLQMNRQQIRAVARAIRTKDFSILNGFPGTGKTSTIVNTVHVLSCLGKSILLTSNTHSAVDNILLKLKDNPDVNFLRLGRLSKINKDLHSLSEETLTRNVKSVQELSDIYNNTNVVATTCLGINHPLFKRRTFDYCIMDEASQILQLASIGPLLYCKCFILVGDALQLPPVVRSTSARTLGMSESLLESLDAEDVTVSLVEQYRMNGPIMEVANKLMYDGRLECGSEELRIATISLAHYDVNAAEEPSCLFRILSDKLEDAVLFLDTGTSSPDSKNSSNLTINLGEAKLIGIILEALLKYGFPPREIGIITPFRAQVKLLKSRLPSDLIEVNTVDQYQGRDKEIILYSCVRSDRSQNFKAGANEILMDFRRLNVATTRAKYKLVIIGDRITLEHFAPFEKLFKVFDKGQIYRVEVPS